jgi:Putative neutral zinc metallopeptidase
MIKFPLLAASALVLGTALAAPAHAQPSPTPTPTPPPKFTKLPPFNAARTPPPSWSVPTQLTACHPPSMAHCYTEATMQSYMGAIIPMVEQFFSASYAHMPKPARYVFVADNYPTTEACKDPDTGSGKVTSAGAFGYCPADNKVYLGQKMLWNFYNDDGDAAGAVSLAHEWGHHVQTVVGVPVPSTPQENRNHENQADCVAGAWLEYAGQRGWLESEDVGAIGRLILDIASSENDPNRTHGDVEERASSMGRGFDGGLDACNSFYPWNPIH